MSETVKVTAVVPTRGLIFAQTVDSLKKNGITDFLIINGLPIPDAQNAAVYKALDTDCTHIWFVEDDMAFPEGTLQAMLKVNEPIVAVNYPLEGGHPTINRKDDVITHCGLGCTLMSTKVFEVISEPWFEADKSIRTNGTIVDTPYKYGGQDIWFGRKVNELGIKIAECTDVTAQHLRCDQLTRIESNKGTYQIRALPPIGG